ARRRRVELAESALDPRQRVGQVGDPAARGAELVAVLVVVLLEPARADAGDQPPTRHGDDGAGQVGQRFGIAGDGAPHQLTHLAPMPRISRPPEMWSTVRAMSASSSGLRYELQVTSAPISMREVCSAHAPNIVQHSKWAPSGSPYSGKKWSQLKAMSTPMSSARRTA